MDGALFFCTVIFSFRARGILLLKNLKRLFNITGLSSINHLGVGVPRRWWGRCREKHPRNPATVHFLPDNHISSSWLQLVIKSLPTAWVLLGGYQYSSFTDAEE